MTAQSADDRSLLSLYRRLLEPRRKEPTLVAGEYEPVRNHGSVLAFWRRLEDRRLLIALNMESSACRFEFDGRGEVLLSTSLGNAGKRVARELPLQPDEGVVSCS